MPMLSTFEEIQAEKERLRTDIEKKKEEIGQIWNGVFHKDDAPLVETPTQRLLRYGKLGVGVLDGALLGWKLYNRLTGTSVSINPFKKKKRK